MKPDVTWLMGRCFTVVEKMDYTWFFRLDDGSVIATEETWRLANSERIDLTSEDHQQRFGLPGPIDAAVEAMKQIDGHPVTGATIHPITGDLNIELGHLHLQFLCMSSGYESWRCTHGTQDLICTGGGRITEFKSTTNGSEQPPA